MSAVELIEQIRALPEEERAKVVRFVIEHEESWIPPEIPRSDARCRNLEQDWHRAIFLV